MFKNNFFSPLHLTDFTEVGEIKIILQISTLIFPNEYFWGILSISKKDNL